MIGLESSRQAADATNHKFNKLMRLYDKTFSIIITKTFKDGLTLKETNIE